MAPEAIVLINAVAGKEKEAAKELMKIDGVRELYSLHGVYDIAARVQGDTLDKLKDTIDWKIRRVNDVRSTLTHTVEETLGKDDLLPANSPDLTPEKCAYKIGRGLGFEDRLHAHRTNERKIPPSVYSLSSTRMNGAALSDFMTGYAGSELHVYDSSKDKEISGNYCSQVCKLFGCNLNEHKDNPKRHIIK